MPFKLLSAELPMLLTSVSIFVKRVFHLHHKMMLQANSGHRHALFEK